MENDCTLQINQKGLYLACDLILIMLIQCMKDIQPLLLKHSLRI